MTTQIKASRFRLRRKGGGAPQPAAQPEAARRDADSRPAASDTAAPETGAPARAEASTELDAIRAENLTARQLRMAMRVAARHGIRPSSQLDAVRLLRKRGIDPFARSTMLELVRADPPPEAAAEAPAPAAEAEGTGRALALRKSKAPAKREASRLPDAAGKARLDKLAAEREAEVARVQAGIARRRRRRMALLAARLAVFVALPTFIVGYYFAVLATPLYATQSEFVIQQAEPAMSGAGGLEGMMPGAGALGLGPSQDSVTVQGFLQSRGAMRRLDAEEGFRAHFSDPSIDALRRLAPDASDEAMYRLYQRHVQIGFDPTEGIVRLEVLATTPEDSERFARALISYAEEQVDLMTARMRDSQMADARDNLAEAEESMRAARRDAVELQERFAVLSGEVEVSMISQQIITLETELSQARLALQDLQANLRPNPARVERLQRRVSNLEDEIATLRGSMTQGDAEGTSLARIQSELIMAEADVQTRQMLLSQALQALESARIEAGRQVRYLSLSVEPIAPDEPSHPRAFESTALAFLVFGGVYLLLAMTASILREQVSG